MLHRLLVHKHITLEEAERILFKLREATSAAEVGDIRASTEEVEDLLEDAIGGNTSTLNPFLFRHFWMGVDTRWPAGGETGVLLVRIINDGPIPMPMLRLKPPVPEGMDGHSGQRGFAHHCAGGNIPLRFDIQPDYRISSEDVPLTRKLSVATAYEMRSGEITVTMRSKSLDGTAFRSASDALDSLWFSQMRFRSSAILLPTKWLLYACHFASTSVKEVLVDRIAFHPQSGGEKKKW